MARMDLLDLAAPVVATALKGQREALRATLALLGSMHRPQDGSPQDWLSVGLSAWLDSTEAVSEALAASRVRKPVQPIPGPVPALTAKAKTVDLRLA